MINFKNMAQYNFYYDPILGLQYIPIENNYVPEAKPNRSERRKIKFQKNTYKNKFGLNRNLY